MLVVSVGFTTSGIFVRLTDPIVSWESGHDLNQFVIREISSDMYIDMDF